MKNLAITMLASCLVVTAATIPVRAEMATADEAFTVAANWISLIMEKKDSWGGSDTPEVTSIHEFKRGERVIGYFCDVEPRGFIIVSLRKELAPIKAYSARSDLDPESEEGLADLIKGKMERMLDTIERQVTSIRPAGAEETGKILRVNYRDAWRELEVDVESFKRNLESGVIKTTSKSGEYAEADAETLDYQEGQVILTTDWHQTDPFNRQCPVPPPGSSCSADHCTVGCVATAGVQIMRHWRWPPYGDGGSPYTDDYDWPNMPNTLTSGSSPAQIDAVAELCHEVGIAVNMFYCSSGCASSANTAYMEHVYEDHYRYSLDCQKHDRSDYTDVAWFERMKTQFNANRPVQYKIPGHSIAGDGWQEIYIGGVLTRQYHMNYGWYGTGADAWYTLDDLLGGDPSNEYMLEDIYPAPALGASLSGTYSRDTSLPYRYFDRDTTGNSATFESGQNLQFLRRVTVTCTSSTGGSIRFYGSSSLNTRLFSNGDETRGVRIHDGAVKLSQNGSIKFE